MNRTEALEHLASDKRVVPEGAQIDAGYFEPSDAPAVARLFYAVYGDGYPVDNYYIPERLIEEHRLGNIYSAVARISTGDVVAHIALYHSSASNPGLYEYGLGLSLPAYRSGVAFFRTTQLIMDLVGKNGIDGIFGEAVCNHTITQKLCSKYSNMKETALEPALMPAQAYEAEQSADGRVGCLFYSRVDLDRHRTLYIPPVYEDELRFILDGLDLDRELRISDIEITVNNGAIEVTRFAFAGVARCTVTAPGENLATLLKELERNLRKDDYALIQFFIDMGKPWSIAVVELMRREGYSLGGLLPIWFGDDGLLMQKHFVNPGFESLKIYSDRGRTLADMVRRDWARSNS